ncbi:hypothetical protein ACFVW2_33605 [Streptomyces sp. NPDC058171]
MPGGVSKDAWITGGATVIAALIGAMVVYGMATDDDGKPSASGKPSSSATATVAPEIPNDGAGEGETDEQPPASTPTPDPAAQVAPDSGATGSKATVSGTGFEPGEKVTIHFEYEGILKDATVDSGGSFAAEVVIPFTAFAQESHEITVTGQSSDIKVVTYFLRTK